jgi:hypothetical protein
MESQEKSATTPPSNKETPCIPQGAMPTPSDQSAAVSRALEEAKKQGVNLHPSIVEAMKKYGQNPEATPSSLPYCPSTSPATKVSPTR